MIEEKDDSLGNKVTKAWLCAWSDLEAGKHIIPVIAPTANKTTIKLLLTLVASRGLEVRTKNVHRAFLPTEAISHTIYSKSPVEAGFLPNKGRLLKELGMYSLQFDSTTFGEFKAAYAAHIDKCLTDGEKQKVGDTHDKIAQKLQYGEVLNHFH